MTVLAQDVSNLTDRYQTTVPADVRKQINPGKGKPGKGNPIRYCTEPSDGGYDGGCIEPVRIEPARTEEENSVPGTFLDFVEADIKAHPERVRAFDGALHDRLSVLVADIVVDVDLDAPLLPENE